ncbi:MAG TPA: transglycosylase SLT domain-containing protein [Dyella sp.]|uniref:transglycosylase SLT domain-containing protein n=1 Tax=Dyella sp. TaxID=1869338 RepID=UPI002D0E1EAE|nr:transglycosylase SLT domain-containing protein [Dyella sp.]HTV86377.1 transglycosylase SLT domain-containing protein [Dyella sp.]
MLCAPAAFRERRTAGRSAPAPRIVMVDPHGWAKRRRIVDAQRGSGAHAAHPTVFADASLPPPSLQQRLNIDAAAMLLAMKQYANVHRRPMSAGLGVAAGVAAFAMFAHSWHAAPPAMPPMTSTVRVPAPPAATVPARIPAPVSARSSVMDAVVAAQASPKILPATRGPKTTLGLADDGTIVVVAPPHPSNMDGFNLDITTPGNLWAKAGARYRIDPVLIYAIALVETRGVQPDGSVAPSPWIVRINGHLHSGTRAESEHAIELANLMAVPVQDVGIMQVYYPMHRDIEPDPIALLNPARNIDVGTRLLRKAMQESSDPVLRIGYYHSHDAQLARGYGQMVLNVYHELKTAMGKIPMGTMAMEHAQPGTLAVRGGG